MEIQILVDKKEFKRGFKQLVMTHDVKDWKKFMKEYNPVHKVLYIKIYLNGAD